MTDVKTDVASRWRRLGGALIDGVIAMAITFPLMKVLGLWQSPTTGRTLTLGQQAFLFLLSLAVWLVRSSYGFPTLWHAQPIDA